MRNYAVDQYADTRFRVKHNVPVFNPPSYPGTHELAIFKPSQVQSLL